MGRRDEGIVGYFHGLNIEITRTFFLTYTPEEPATEAVPGHQGPRFESRSQPPAEVGYPPAQRMEERPVE